MIERGSVWMNDHTTTRHSGRMVVRVMNANERRVQITVIRQHGVPHRLGKRYTMPILAFLVQYRRMTK